MFYVKHTLAPKGLYQRKGGTNEFKTLCMENKLSQMSDWTFEDWFKCRECHHIKNGHSIMEHRFKPQNPGLEYQLYPYELSSCRLVS